MTTKDNNDDDVDNSSNNNKNVDWSTVDIDQLERDWQSKLDASYSLTVESLGEAAVESRDLLPLLDQASSALQQISGQYGVYCLQLQAMAKAVHHIQLLNQDLSIQSRNQQSLLDVLDSLPFMSSSGDVDVDDDDESGRKVSVETEIMAILDKPDKVSRVADLMTKLVDDLTSSDDPDLAGMLAVRQWRQGVQETSHKTAQSVSDYVCNVHTLALTYT